MASRKRKILVWLLLALLLAAGGGAGWLCWATLVPLERTGAEPLPGFDFPVTMQPLPGGGGPSANLARARLFAPLGDDLLASAARAPLVALWRELGAELLAALPAAPEGWRWTGGRLLVDAPGLYRAEGRLEGAGGATLTLALRLRDHDTGPWVTLPEFADTLIVTIWGRTDILPTRAWEDESGRHVVSLWVLSDYAAVEAAGDAPVDGAVMGQVFGGLDLDRLAAIGGNFAQTIAYRANYAGLPRGQQLAEAAKLLEGDYKMLALHALALAATPP